MTNETLWMVVRDRPTTIKGKYRTSRSFFLKHKPGVWGVYAASWFEARQRLLRHWPITSGTFKVVKVTQTTLSKKDIESLEALYARTRSSESKSRKKNTTCRECGQPTSE